MGSRNSEHSGSMDSDEFSAFIGHNYAIHAPILQHQLHFEVDNEPSSRLEIKYKSSIHVEQDAGEVVTSIDLHPTEPWIMASFDNGMIRIWNYQTLTIFASSKRSSHSVFSAKFMPRKHWVVAALDDLCIGLFDYRLEPCKAARKAHDKTIKCLAVHPTSPYALSSADDMLIKLWDWEKKNTRRFEGHSQPVVQVKFNPKDPNIFASASLGQTIKMWNIESSTPAYTVNTRSIVTCVDFFTAGDEPYFVTCSNDNTAKVWDYRTESLVSSVGMVTGNTCRRRGRRVSAVCFHAELPILITGSEDGDVSIWDSTTYGLEQSLLKGKELGKVWAIGCMKGSTRVFIFYSELIMMVKIGREEPAASMDNSGKVVWAKHKKIQTADISVESDHEVSDGESLRVEIEELSTCDFYTQSLKCDPNGKFAVCGGGKYIIPIDPAWKQLRSGSALEIVWSPAGEYAARETELSIKIYSKDFQEKKSIRPSFSAERIYGGTLLSICSEKFICFYDWADGRLIQRINVIVKNVYWSERSDQVAIVSDESLYMLKFKRGRVSSYLASIRTSDEGVQDAFEILYKIGERVRTGIWVRTGILAEDCFIYNNSARRLNYCVGGKVTTMFHLDRPMYLLGYLASQSKVYLIDRDFNVTKYTLPLSLVEYKTLVMHGDLEQAKQILPSIPKEQLNSVARFLELQGMIKAASEVATDPDYKFELATQLGKLKMAKDNKHIVWEIVVKGTIKNSVGEKHASGFTVKGDVSLGEGRELVVLSCALIFVQFECINAIQARRLDEKYFRQASMIYMNNRLNLAALKVDMSSGDDYGVLAREGSIFPGERLFYLGNPVNFVGSHLVGKACYPCINEVFRIQGCECGNYVSSVIEKTCNIRRMGDLYDRKYLKLLGENEKMYESGIDALVPIIQISGLLDRDGVLGGPVFNSRGEVVGMLVSSFEAEFQIAVHVRAIDTFFRLLGAYYFKHVDKIMT